MMLYLRQGWPANYSALLQDKNMQAHADVEFMNLGHKSGALMLSYSRAVKFWELLGVRNQNMKKKK